VVVTEDGLVHGGLTGQIIGAASAVEGELADLRKFL